MKKTIFILMAICALASCKKNDKDPIRVEEVWIFPDVLLLAINETQSLTTEITPENATNKTATWSSSNPAVVSVSHIGVVKGLTEGTATITATIDGKSGMCEITVSATAVAVTGVSLNKTTLTLEAGTSETLVATIAPENATNREIIWTSSNESVATVDENGNVTAIATGTTIIGATISGKSDVCTVTVSPKPIK